MTRRVTLLSMMVALLLLSVGGVRATIPGVAAKQTVACCCDDPTCLPGCTPECAVECLPVAKSKANAKASCCSGGDCCPDEGCCPSAMKKTTTAKRYDCPPCPFCP